MAVNLQKGQKVELKKNNGGVLTKVVVGLGWDEAKPVKKKGGFFSGFSGRTSDIDCDAVKYFYQKRFDGTAAQKYFITAKKWEMCDNTGKQVYNGFEYEVQLYQKGTHLPLNLTFHKEWTLDDVENYVEEIYITGLFEPYDEYKMS